MRTSTELKQRLQGQLETVLPHLLPGGAKKGKYFQAGDLQGGSGESLKVNMRDQNQLGVWQDYATGEKGDILDLWMLSQNVNFKKMMDEAAKFSGFTHVRPLVPKRIKPDNISQSEVKPISNSAVIEYLDQRGISVESLIKYQVRSFDHTHTPGKSGKDHICFRFWDSDLDLVMLKTISIHRLPGDKKDIWSTTPAYYTLFGWTTVKNSDRKCIITEGEIDCMSLDQMGPKDENGIPIPVLSMPNGTSGDQWIENDFDRLAQFERIYVCCDNDAAGRKCAADIANRLGILRTFNLPLPTGGAFNDVNEVLLSGDETKTDVTTWFGGAFTYDPPTIQGAREGMEELNALFARARKEEINHFVFPSMKFQLRDGESTLLTGYPGSGKSQLAYQILLHEMTNAQRVLLCSYEIKPAEMKFCLLKMMYGLDAEEKKEEGIDYLTDKMWFVNPKYPTVLDDLWRDIEYSRDRYGTTRVAVDSLHFMTAKDDYNEQDAIARKFVKMNQQFSSHGILTAHSKIKELGADKVPGQGQVEGSGGVTRPFHNGVSMWRNILKTRAIEKAEELEDNEKLGKAEALHDAVFDIWKQRSSRHLKRYRLYFDTEHYSFRTTKLPLEPDDQEEMPF